MGLLQNGKWIQQWQALESSTTQAKPAVQFRSWISADGEAGFSAEKNRYHLYVSLACPWAHRTLIMRKLKHLEDYIAVTHVEPIMLEHGWELTDPLYGFQYAHQLYLRANAQYEGRVSVPILWDKKTQTIVNNESSEIIRMFNSAFNHLTGDTSDYYPQALRSLIDPINQRIFDTINIGVYHAGFASTQAVYEQAVQAIFDSLDWLEDLLSHSRYLTGAQITEADWRLFTTLIRFDSVYFGHFKVNLRALTSYPALSNYVRELYQLPGIAETTDFSQIKTHYYASHTAINPTGIVALGPLQDFTQPHNREQY
jgi:putative glutathione S-transferase